MIAVFGGAFNPPTIAHYEIAKHVLRLSFVVSLLFVPVGDQYKKAGLIPANHRINMLKIMIRWLPDANVSEVEIKARRAFKTIETLQLLQAKYPEADLAFVLGADNLGDLPHWYSHNRLVEQFKMIIFNRGGFDVHAFIKEHFEKAAENFIIIDDFKKIDISSSQYRSDVSKKEILLPEIEKYITKHNLYR